MLNNIANKMYIVVLKNTKLKLFKIKNFCKTTKFKCYKISAHQNREINMLQQFHVIR